MKIDIRSLTENQIIEFFLDKGFDSYRGKQVYEWIWKKSIYSFDDMTNLSKDLRIMFDTHFVITHIEVDKIQKQKEHENQKEKEFSEKIDELNQETDTLLDEIDKWQM